MRQARSSSRFRKWSRKRMARKTEAKTIDAYADIMTSLFLSKVA
jgi:hypothetical protein